MTTTRDAFEAEANLYDLDLNRFKEGYSDCNTDYGWLFWQAATLAAKRQPLDLSEYRIKHGWEQTFSTDNPFCPCNLKSFTKAVNWAVADLNAAHGIKA